MRTLSAPMEGFLAEDATRPGYLIEIAFNSSLKLSSRGTIEWNGATWLGWDVDVGGLSFDAKSATAQGTLSVSNTDLTVSTLCFAEGVAEREVSIWKFYGDAFGDDDALKLYTGSIDSCRVDYSRAAVQFQITQVGGRTAFAPRRFMTKAEGFNIIPPDGTRITWSGEVFELQSEK